MSEETKRSALFGILSIVLWCLMAIPMYVGIVWIESEFVGDFVGIICCGTIIPNIAGLALGIRGLKLGDRANADVKDHNAPWWVLLIPIGSALGIILNLLLSWPVFAIWLGYRHFIEYGAGGSL